MAESAAARQRRSRAHRRGDHSLCNHPTTLQVVPDVAPSGGRVSLEGTVRAALEDAGRADSYLGVAALTLAARVDGSEGVLSLAPVLKELRETMDRALAGAEKSGRMMEMRRGRKRGSEALGSSAS